LRQWLADPAEDISVLLIHGEGGQGKTRMANHVASLAYQDGWIVAQAVQKAARTGPGRPVDRCDAARLLAVVDYADRWPLDLLGKLMDDLRFDHAHQPVRVLLLARPQVGFWRDASAVLDRSDIDLAEPKRLADFTTTPAQRHEAFDEA